MSRVLKADAINEIVKTMEMGELEKANKMTKIVMDSINQDKQSNSKNEYVELNKSEDIRLFKNLISDDKIGG